jgi:DNA-binding NarL/FixJ family response regulator
MDAVHHASGPITILIAVAVRLYREGLAETLSSRPHFRVEGTVGTALEAQAALRALKPAVVIVDVTLDGGRSTIQALRAESETSHIIAFAVREDVSTIIDLAAAGANGFVTASGSVAELVEAIERVAEGELLCSPRLASQLLRRAAHQINTTEHVAGPALTSREQQVFSLLQQGSSNKEIAATLHIAEATVKNHVHHLLEKLRVGSRGQAAAIGRTPMKVALEPTASRRAV